MSVIYKIKNVVNGNFYIGSSINVRTRFQTHRRQLRAGKHHCQPLLRAWLKYGEECFKFEIVEEVGDGNDLLAAEDRWLGDHHGQRYCYNVSRHPTALWLGMKHSDEAKAKLSEAHKGKQHRLGQTNSPEHRAKQSAGMRGIKKSPEHIEKIRQRMLGTSYAKGRIMPEDQKAAMGKALVEVTTGLEFITVAQAAGHFGISRPNLVRAMRGDGRFTRGPNKGLQFQSLPPTPD